MTDSIVFYLNFERIEVSAKDNDLALMSLAEFMRKRKHQPGTKIVCAEGDCGACTVLMAPGFALTQNKIRLLPINSCIYPIYLLNGAQIINIEGLADGIELHPVQNAMMAAQGTQCGFCTPGIVMALAGMTEVRKSLGATQLESKDVKNHLTGNLCRCTGYDSIIKAGTQIDVSSSPSLVQRYLNSDRISELQKIGGRSVKIENQNLKIFLPATLKEALQIKSEYPQVKLISGSTDLGVLINKGRYSEKYFMSLQSIPELYKDSQLEGYIRIGSQVTLSRFEKIVEKSVPELNQLLKVFASPQIKNVATVVGNIANASPIGDLIPFMLVSQAQVMAQSWRGERKISLDDFYLGYKKLDLENDEIIVGLQIPKPLSTDFLKLYKVSNRKDLDISIVTFAGSMQIKDGKIAGLKMALGGVGPVVLRLKEAENFLIGKSPEQSIFKQAADQVVRLITPLTDVRASKDYRNTLASNLIMKFFFDYKKSIGDEAEVFI